MSERPSSQAVALTYDGKSAPFVSASGSQELAEEIIRIARENEIPIYENPQLVDILARLEVGDEIPELLYRTIAEIIAFVYMLKGKTPEGFGAPTTDRITPRLSEPGSDSEPDAK